MEVSYSLIFLELKKCKPSAERKKTAADKDEWTLMETKAKNYIVNAISNEQLELVFSELTAFNMLNKFDSVHLKKSPALQIITRQKLEKMRLQVNDDPYSFFNDFKRATNDLKAAGAKVTKTEKANYLINALPESMAYLGDLVDLLKNDENVFEYLKYKISAKAKGTGVQASRDGGVNSQVFAANSGRRPGSKTSNFTCFKCGKVGHRRFE